MRRVTCLPTLEKQRARHFVNAVEAFADECTSAEPGELLNRLRQVKKTLRRTGLDNALNDGTAAEAFALVRELAGRTLTRRHYPCQLMGGWLILNGMLAEMDTGEGKTLTATLPAAIAAMAGIPVHVITTSDYLARRDAENLAPLYRVLGLSVGVVTDDMQTPAERRAAYACDITYTTNKQIGFDYLRDRAGGHTRSRLDRLLQRCGETMQQPVLRGLCFGIIDEADSVLIDEATTPLILARAVKNSPAPEHYGVALACAARLQQGRDYTQHDRRIDLTPHGRE
ncbi:MAG: DEAD/DEAH box helicase, partial [Gammaproteobacteria bacterium]|nr:DEAD/DEAH box helicase [Gammaproteobacteria bacterium]